MPFNELTFNYIYVIMLLEMREVCFIPNRVTASHVTEVTMDFATKEEERLFMLAYYLDVELGKLKRKIADDRDLLRETLHAARRGDKNHVVINHIESVLDNSLKVYWR